MLGFTAGASALFEQTQYKGHNRHDDEHEEQNLGDAHGTGSNTAKLDLSAVTDIPFATLSAVIGLGGASLEGTVLTLEGQTSAVLR